MRRPRIARSAKGGTKAKRSRRPPGVKPTGLKRSGLKRSGLKRSGVKRSGLKRSGVKLTGSSLISKFKRTKRESSDKAVAAPTRVVSRAEMRRQREQKRIRLMLLVALIFSTFVLVTSFPLSSLFNQRHQQQVATRQLSVLRQENQSLQAQEKRLASPDAAADLSRKDFGFVKKGQKEYDVIPPSGSSQGTDIGDGQVPLNGAPVVPGSSQSQALLGAGTAKSEVEASNDANTDDSAQSTGSTVGSTSGSAGPGESSGGSAGGRAGSPTTGDVASPATPGFWTRVAQSFEFWR